MRISFEVDHGTWDWGYHTAFAQLGFAALVIGPWHINFEQPIGADAAALQTPWRAVSTWLRERRAPIRNALGQHALMLGAAAGIVIGVMAGTGRW